MKQCEQEAVAQRCSVKNVLKNFTKFTGKQIFQNFITKIQAEA